MKEYFSGGVLPSKYSGRWRTGLILIENKESGIHPIPSVRKYHQANPWYSEERKGVMLALALPPPAVRPEPRLMRDCSAFPFFTTMNQ